MLYGTGTKNRAHRNFCFISKTAHLSISASVLLFPLLLFICIYSQIWVALFATGTKINTHLQWATALLFFFLPSTSCNIFIWFQHYHFCCCCCFLYYYYYYYCSPLLQWAGALVCAYTPHHPKSVQSTNIFTYYIGMPLMCIMYDIYMYIFIRMLLRSTEQIF